VRLYKKASNKELNISFLKDCAEFAKKLSLEGAKFDRKPMIGVNSEFMDYAPTLFDGGKRLFFVSRRSNTTGGMRNPADQVYFEDVYEAVWNPKKQEWDSVSNKLGKLNSPGFDAVSFISADGDRIYMTINNTMDPKVKRKDLTGSSDIAMAKLSKNGTWPKPKLITGGVNTDFFEGSPTLTKNEQTMFFAAQRITSDGPSTELFVSTLEGKNWSKAIQLPKTINNKGRQTTPFISPDGTYLFFSSDAHLGMGGYDIFVSKLHGSQWSIPINLGFGINSVNDDTHFKYYPELKLGVFASVENDGSRATYNLFTVNMANFDLGSLPFEWE
jgi:Tol biopolymer transport system component